MTDHTSLPVPNSAYSYYIFKGSKDDYGLIEGERYKCVVECIKYKCTVATIIDKDDIVIINYNNMRDFRSEWKKCRVSKSL